MREGGVRQRKIGEPDANHPAAQVQVRRGRGVGPGQQRLRHPERAQHLQRAGMHDQSAGGPERLRPPVDDPHIGAVVMGLQGQGQAGRAGAGHQDAGRARHETAARRHQAARIRRRVGQDLRPRQQLVAAQPGQHDVVDRARHRHQREHPPQGARVGPGLLGVIPLIQAPVTATLVVGQPQLGDQAREAREQGRVEEAFPAENGVPPAAHRPQPEPDHQHARVARRVPVDDRLPVHPRRCSIREPQPHPHVPAEQVQPPPPKEPRRARGAAGHRPQRRPVSERRLLGYDSRALMFRRSRQTSPARLPRSACA